MHGYISKFNKEDEVDFIKVITLHNDGEFSTHAAVEPYPLGVQEHEVSPGSLIETCFSTRPSDDHSKYMKHIYTSEKIKFAGLPSEHAEVSHNFRSCLYLRTLAELKLATRHFFYNNMTFVSNLKKLKLLFIYEV